mmetsp:Transcript_20513/g.82020  ORF Transcript_20513/g.82020 Transcript_20513/m.82020 type:complete len:221 (-) Transcript_20513:1016-1678(-)
MSSSRSRLLIRARFCSRALRMTATATAFETSRMRLTEGNTWPRACSSADTLPAQASEAARSISSETRRAFASVAPSPMPGKRNMLLHCDGTKIVPSRSTGANGEPDANTARPAVHSYAWRAVHSARSVGFDSAITTGRWPAGHAASNARMTSSVKSPGDAVSPSRIDGLAAVMTSRSDAPRRSPFFIEKDSPNALCSGASAAHSASEAPSFAMSPSLSRT